VWTLPSSCGLVALVRGGTAATLCQSAPARMFLNGRRPDRVWQCRSMADRSSGPANPTPSSWQVVDSSARPAWHVGGRHGGSRAAVVGVERVVAAAAGCRACGHGGAACPGGCLAAPQAERTRVRGGGACDALAAAPALLGVSSKSRAARRPVEDLDQRRSRRCAPVVSERQGSGNPRT
jgi:hypothetical protein